MKKSQTVSRPPVPAGLATMPGFSELTQVAIITPHADRTIETLGVALGAGSFKVVDMRAPALFDTTFRGAPEAWAMRLGITWIGNTQIEVIQPTGGRTVFSEYLESRAGRAGIQHIFLDRDTIGYDDALRKLEEAGYPLVQRARMNASGRIGIIPMPAMPSFLAARFGARFGYTSSRDALKLDIELAKFPPGVSQRLALRAAIPDRWIPEEDHEHFESLPPDAFLRDIDAVYVFGADLVALIDAYGKLTDRPPEIERFRDDQLPGEGRIARIRFNTSTLCLVEPASGALRALLADRGEGVQLLRGRPASDMETVKKSMASRGWRVDGMTKGTGREEGALLATHEEVPFALWVHAAQS